MKNTNCKSSLFQKYCKKLLAGFVMVALTVMVGVHGINEFFGQMLPGLTVIVRFPYTVSRTDIQNFRLVLYSGCLEDFGDFPVCGYPPVFTAVAADDDAVSIDGVQQTVAVIRKHFNGEGTHVPESNILPVAAIDITDKQAGTDIAGANRIALVGEHGSIDFVIGILSHDI